MTTILLADDHPFVREGLRLVLENQPGLKIIGEVEDGLATLEKLEHLKPDILILDIMMPGLNGLEVARRVKQKLPQIKIIMLSMHSNEPYVLEALRSGVSAYVLKSAPTVYLVEAVRAAERGQRYLSPPLTEFAIEAYVKKAGEAAEEIDNYMLLSAREREVFQLAAEGYSNLEIATRLSISPRTAETHRSNLMRKLRFHNETELVRYAIQRGIISESKG